MKFLLRFLRKLFKPISMTNVRVEQIYHPLTIDQLDSAIADLTAKISRQPIPLDEGVDLSQSDMSYVQFPKKRIRRVNFYSSKFSGAHFGGSEFEACNFSGSIFDECNATGTKFTESNFRGASLRNADLEGVYFGMNDFSGADFTGANLRGANLHSVDLTKATLSNSILRDADLVTAKGVQASQLTGSDLTGAKLPTSIAEFSAIAHVEKISDQAKTLFLTMLAACSFCILTVGTTTDVNLITNRSTSPLPIIQTAIPIVGFYYIAPLILLGIFIYLLLYLQRLWDSLADLPAFFLDGKPLDKTVYPWLLSGLVRSYVIRLRDNRPPFSRLQSFLSIVSAWWVVPITLCILWLRTLPKHDLVLSAWMVLSVALALFIGMRFHFKARETLRGESSQKPDRHKSELTGSMAFALGTSVLVVAALYGISYWATYGTHRPISGYFVPPSSGERVFTFLRNFPLAELSNEDVSHKPLDWRGDSAQLDAVQGVQLIQVNLRYCVAVDAFFAKSSIIGCDLTGGSFERADFRYALLSYCDARKSSFGAADFRNARLGRVDFGNAFLASANFQEADLAETHFDSCKLMSSKFKFADLDGATLRGANVESADFSLVRNLSKEQIVSASNWPLAIYDSSMLRLLRLPQDHSVRLISKGTDKFDPKRFQLGGYKLKRVHFAWAHLMHADLTGASIDSSWFSHCQIDESNCTRASFIGTSFDSCSAYLTNFSGADLRGAYLTNLGGLGVNFTNADLRGAVLTNSDLPSSIFYGARLDSADLRGANLTNSFGLSVRQLSTCVIDSTTLLRDEIADSLGKETPFRIAAKVVKNR